MTQGGSKNKNKNKHNRGGFKSIGSQVGSNLGGHLSSTGKGPSGGGGNSFFNSVQSWLGGPAYAHNMGQITGKLKSLDSVPSDWKVKQFADKNIDLTKLNPSFQVNISTQRAINNVKDEDTRDWLNKVLPQKVKDWRIDHQMYSPTKVMPGDPGYNVTGTGTPTLDPDTERYLDWAARKNPSGMTVADAEKLYANQIKGGSTLERAMSSNPAETGSYYALLPSNKEAEPTSEPEPKPTMDLNKIYNELLGRDVGQEGQDYWGSEFDSGRMSIQNIRDSIKQSTEYKGNLQPPTVQPSTIRTTGLTPPTFSPATVAPVGSGGSNTSTLNVTSQQVAPSWNVATRSIDDPYASDPNYTTTAPTSGDPQQPFKAGGNTYYRTGGNQTVKADLHPAYSGYQGAAETGYTNTLADFINSRGGTGVGHKDSEWDRTLENIWQQNKLDELTRHAQQSGVGTFTRSEAGTPQWMPEGVDRGTGERTTEDIWQQGQLSDLEAWAQTAADKYGLTFKPSDVYSVLGKDGKESRHTNEGMRRNESQFSGINNLVDFISQLDTARSPEIAANKEQLSSIYGGEIDRLYNELFDTDTGIDQAGKDYWTKDLIENRPGLAKGQDWQDWLGRAFKNTHSFKDHEVSKGPIVLPIEGIDDTGGNTSGGGYSTPTYNFSDQLKQEEDKWDIRFKELTDSYSSQINDLRKTLEESSRSNTDLLKGYQDQVAGYRKDLNAQAAYGERPMNQSVKGVKTRNELPGYKPKTGGSTGHFNRTGSRLSTSSLNVA